MNSTVEGLKKKTKCIQKGITTDNVKRPADDFETEFKNKIWTKFDFR